MTLNERVREAFAALGITQAEFARRCGVSRATVNDWLSGSTRALKGENLLVAARALGVRPEWLTSGAEPMRALNDSVRPYRAARRVPLISWAAAGDWSEVQDPFPPGAAERWIDATVPVGPHAFALRVVGDSMEPAIAEGALVIIDPEREAVHGKIVLAKRISEHTATIKRLWFDGATPYLKPENQRYPLLPVTDDIRIIGVAVSVYQEL